MSNVEKKNFPSLSNLTSEQINHNNFNTSVLPRKKAVQKISGAKGGKGGFICILRKYVEYYLKSSKKFN